jgi:parvulin-like peptidyl-prolyl isomerase
MKKRKLPKVTVRVPQKLKELKASKKLSNLPGLSRRLTRRAAEARAAEAIQGLPRITNETVAEHREEVLSSARKYIYPLSHSKHRVVKITTGLLIVAVIAFFTYCGLALYKFHATSGFVYGVTKVIPFPVAKAGSAYVSYENYLFELRHSMHYYQSEQQVSFSSKSGKTLLAHLKSQALQQVINAAYIKQLAAENHVSVSGREVDDEVALVRSQNRLGSNNQVFSDVLKQFWGWSVDDFKRELKSQLLAQKVVAKLDTATQKRAQDTLNQLKGGADFATLASQVSDDASTKGNGGNYGFLIDKSNQNIAPQVTAALFNLQAGQYSNIINAGYSLEIDKVVEINGDKVQAAHIVFNFKSIDAYIAPLKAKDKPHDYIHVQ